MRKGLIILLCLVLLLPALAWLTLPWTAQYLLQHWLQQQGFDRPQLIIQHPSWQQLRIDHLSVSQDSNGRRLHLSADNIDIRFSPLALLQGQIQELRVEHARLGIEADASIRGRLQQLEQHSEQLDLNSFHPSLLFQYAPSRRLVIAQLELHYSAPEQPDWQAQGNLDLEPELLQSRIQLLKDRQPLGYLDLSFDPAFNLALSLSRDNHFLLRSAHQLSFPDQHWQLRSDMLLDTAQTAVWLQQLRPDIELPVHSPSGQIQLHTRLTLPNPLPTQLPQLLAQLDLQLNSQVKVTTAQGPGFSQSALDLDMEAELAEGQLALTAKSGSNLNVSGIQQDGVRLEQLTARLTQPAQFNGDWQKPLHWQHSPISLQVSPDGIRLPQPVGLALQPINIRLEGGQLLRPVYPVKLNLPDISLKPETQPALNLSMDASLQLDRLKQSLQARAGISSSQLPLQLSMDAHLNNSAAGNIDFRLQDTAVARLHTSLRPWLPAELRPLKVNQGTLKLQGKVRLTPGRWSIQASPALQHLNLTWDEHTHVIDLNITQNLKLDSSGSLRSSGRLELDHTDSGVRIFGPQLDFDLSLPGKGSPRLNLSGFSLSALDGLIAVPPLSFNPLHPEIDTRIAISALELERVLALYPQEGLYGSGVLGGALPLKLEGNRLSIHNGQLISQGNGGVIRYQAPPEILLMGQQNPGIKLALDALTDFRFDLLDLTLDYAPSGDAVMRARLKGRNPGWQQGRPVDLNLNIEENLLDLLRTLRLTDRVTDAIDRRFRR